MERIRGEEGRGGLRQGGFNLRHLSFRLELDLGLSILSLKLSRNKGVRESWENILWPPWS